MLKKKYIAIATMASSLCINTVYAGFITDIGPIIHEIDITKVTQETQMTAVRVFLTRIRDKEYLI